MKRGDVYWAEMKTRSGSKHRGCRPVVIISNDGFNEVSTWRSIIVIPVTTSPHQVFRGQTVVPLSAAGLLPSSDSVAICHRITTLDRAKLGKKIGTLTSNELDAIEQGIRAACDLPDVS